MSLLPVDTIHSITESVGVSLKEPAAQALVADAEYRLRELIFDARKFMRHARRSRMTPADINAALAVRNVQPLYGYSSGAPTKFRSTIHAASTRIYYLEDHEIDLDQLINAPLPPLPLDVAFTAHWLAIDGVQPAIVQNPTPADLRELSSSSSSTSPNAIMAANAAQSQLQQQSAVLISSNNPDQATINGDVLVKHVLSKELQLYHDKITEAVLDADDKVSALAIDSLQNDPGIQPLLPYFVQFMTQKTTKNVRNLKVNWSMMRMTRALLNNKNLFIEPYLHQLIPIMITCIVSKRLSESPLDDHHALRRFAAQLVAYVCHTYNGTYPVLQQRVTKTLLRAFLDPNKPIGTYYGAIVGLAGLGDQVVGILLRPNVKAFTTNCLEKNKSGSDGGGNVTAVTLTGTEKRDKDLVIELLVDVLHKHILTEYEQTERFVLNKDPASVTRPTLQQLEYEFTDAFGVEYGAKVAGLVDASLSARNSNVSKSQGKKRATVQNDMDVD